MDQNLSVFTVGHSTLTYEKFVGLLKSAGVNVVADVRSFPSSRRFPHFDSEELAYSLRKDSIGYVFLGDLLGGRPKGQKYFCEGIADYEAMRSSEKFQEGIKCVLEGAERRCLALMCSEHNPLDCHRCLLVGRDLIDREVQVLHILQSGEIVSQAQIEEKLVKELQADKNLFADTFDQSVTAAYRNRANKVAYRLPLQFKRVAAE